MTRSVTPLIADQLVDCIANGRDPTVQELFGLAERIWADVSAKRSAFAWSCLPSDSTDRLMALRAAQMALTGTPNR